MSEFDATRAARRMWHLLETVHAVTYFAPEAVAALKATGLKGFWMTYFAGRSAPLGPASPQLVAATFFNFHESMIRRSVPDAWHFASPNDVLDARLDGVDHALRRILGPEELNGAAIQAAADLAQHAIEGCSRGGRPLFAANAALRWPDEPHLRLWQAATLIREHRGDGHIASNLADGIDGLASLVMMCGTGTIARADIQPNRGWSDEQWHDTTERLTRDGLLHDGKLTREGRDRRQGVEDATDRLAAEPWGHLGRDRTVQLHQLLRPVAEAIVAAQVVPFPNAVGLPAWFEQS